MITFSRFEQHIASKQLQKGKFYFEEELVCNLYEARPGYWKADVSGREDYEVQVTIENGEVTATYCNCPHEVDFCKHVVAVLYAVQEESDKRKEDSGTGTDGFNELIYSIPEAQLRRFVTDYGRTNSAFRDFTSKKLTQAEKSIKPL